MVAVKGTRALSAAGERLRSLGGERFEPVPRPVVAMRTRRAEMFAGLGEESERLAAWIGVGLGQKTAVLANLFALAETAGALVKLVGLVGMLSGLVEDV